MMKCISIAIAALLASLGAASPAFADPESGLEGIAAPMSDQALDTMRGKYVAPSGVAYFGIVMSSSWQGTNGITTDATLLFSINFEAAAAGSPSGMPVVMVSWSRDCQSCGDSSMDVTNFSPASGSSYVALTGNGSSIPIGSLNTVNGVVQSQQIAGSDNQSHNAMSIQIVPAGTLSYNTTGMTALGQGQKTETFSDGETLQFNYTNQQLGVGLSGQNGTAQQSVNGSLGQLAQNIFIGGSNIVASNSMNLVIGIDPAAAAQKISVRSALTAMKGFGF